jgi:hypothetical protein
MNLAMPDNPPQFSYAPGVPDSLYRSKTAPLGMYESKVNKMPVPWDLFKTVVTGFWAVVTLLLGGLCFLVWNNLSSVREDVNLLRSEATGIRHDLSDARLELTKAVGNVEKEVAITNGKLETTNANLAAIVSELQRTRPRH